MSLAEVKEKIKAWAALLTRKDVYAALVIIFVGLASFCLGALWQNDENRPAMTIQDASAAAQGQNGADEEGSTTDAYVGSWTSKIYRLKTCSGVKAVRESNRVYFASKSAAEAAGYVPAKNCSM